MRYMMLTYESRDQFAARDDARRTEEYKAGWKTFIAAMSQAGIVEYPGHGLEPGTAACTVRTDGEQPVVAHGAYAASDHQLGGYFIIDVPDLDTAIRWANRCPAAQKGVVELRPVWSFPQ